MLQLHHLLLFHAVAQTRSISAGAERLMISQPAVSKQIRQMEKSLKTKLFDRHAKGVDLTQAGNMLAGYAKRIFDLLDEAEQGLEDFSSLKRGSLSVGAGPTVGVYLFPAAMVRFRRAHPDVLLRTETEETEVLRQRLLDGSIDLAISESPMDSKELQSKILFHDELVPVSCKGNALSGKQSITPDEFGRQPLIARQVKPGTRSLVERTLVLRGLEITPVLTVSSTEAIKQAVIAGLGVAIVSQMAIQTEVAAGLLVKLNVRSLHIRCPIQLIWRKDRSPGKLAAEFIGMLNGS